MLCALLIDRSGSYLFRPFFASSTIEQAFFDVLVLTLTPGAPRLSRHFCYLLSFLFG